MNGKSILDNDNFIDENEIDALLQGIENSPNIKNDLRQITDEIVKRNSPLVMQLISGDCTVVECREILYRLFKQVCEQSKN